MPEIRRPKIIIVPNNLIATFLSSPDLMSEITPNLIALQEADWQHFLKWFDKDCLNVSGIVDFLVSKVECKKL